MSNIEDLDTYILHTWRITESREELMALCHDKQIACDHIAKVKSDKRACEMLAELLLLKSFSGNESPVLCHTEDGAPYIKDSKAHISITHSKDLVCIGISLSRPIGIDIETNPDKILRVRSKFLSDEELEYIPENDRLKNQLAWSAKEAIYKAASISGLSIKDDIRLNELITGGTVTHNGKTTAYSVVNEFHYDDNYIVSVTRPE